MTDLRKLRLVSARIFQMLNLMIVGAWLLTLFLQWRYPGADLPLRQIENHLFGACLAFLMIGQFLQPREAQADSEWAETAPRLSGTFVVLATGAAAAWVAGTIGVGIGQYWGPAIIVVATIAVALVVWRFATRHAGEIGEARHTR